MTHEHSQNALSFLDQLLGGMTFMPHGHCYLWTPSVLWFEVLTNLLIGLAYVYISVSLYRLVRRVRLPFSIVFVFFGTFICFCGLTHFMDVLTIWKPYYWLQIAISTITAIASVGTAFYIYPLFPKVETLYNATELAEKRKHEAEIARKEAEFKTSLLNLVAHELRTPLTSLSLHLQMAQKRGVRPENQNEIERSLAASRELAQLIDGLLDFARADQGALNAKNESVDVITLLHAIEDEMRAVAEDKGLKLDVRLAEPIAPIVTDGRLLRIVLLNLVTNAIKYTKKGSITIEASESENATFISVKDTGVGIPKEAYELVFQPFAQLEGVDHKSTPGVGLGLSIVRQITQQLDIDVSIKSEVGVGTRFSLTIPRAVSRVDN